MTINLQEKLISLGKVVYQNPFWSREGNSIITYCHVLGRVEPPKLKKQTKTKQNETYRWLRVLNAGTENPISEDLKFKTFYARGCPRTALGSPYLELLKSIIRPGRLFFEITK